VQKLRVITLYDMFINLVKNYLLGDNRINLKTDIFIKFREVGKNKKDMVETSRIETVIEFWNHFSDNSYLSNQFFGV